MVNILRSYLKIPSWHKLQSYSDIFSSNILNFWISILGFQPNEFNFCVSVN